MHTHLTTTTQDLLNHIAAQDAIIAELSTCHLGILSNGGLRRALAHVTEPADIIAIDWRKLHEWNDILGYDVSNLFLAEFAQTRCGNDRRHTPRTKRSRRAPRLDVRGQWGGDEFVFAVAAGDGLGLLMRLLGTLDALTAQLSATQRIAIAERTGGLIDGFAVVVVLIQDSTDVYHYDSSRRDAGDAARAVVECGKLKAGNVTGDRATSGRAGTIIGTLVAGAAE